MVVASAPASSANLGAGFDVFAMALDLSVEVGDGDPPEGVQPLAADHPVTVCFDRLGGSGPIWLRTDIPMARGLGFSGAARIAAAGLAVARGATAAAIEDPAHRERMLRVVAAEEGHGDNAAASLDGGVVAHVDGRVVRFPVGPVLGASRFVAWVPDVTTSTDRSRATLSDVVVRSAVVHNLGRATQFALAFAHDDPDLLRGATDDRLHQPARLPLVPGAREALGAAVEAGAWCGWLSGSGPTVGCLVDPVLADQVGAAMLSGAEAVGPGGHTKTLAIDSSGLRVH